VTLAEVNDRMAAALAEDPLSKEATQLVTARGADDPRVVFIGEAPGKQEDEQGEPFVGRAGDLLEEWIDALGLTEDAYAITNIVKYRPPDNRTPTQEERERFGPWLEAELEAMDPEYIITLGKTATSHFIEDMDSFLSDVCYTATETVHGTVVPFPHPAYLLRQGGGLPELERLPEEVEL